MNVSLKNMYHNAPCKNPRITESRGFSAHYGWLFQAAAVPFHPFAKKARRHTWHNTENDFRY